MITDAIEKKGLDAIIARSADFFSGCKRKECFNEYSYTNLAKGKKSAMVLQCEGGSQLQLHP